MAEFDVSKLSASNTKIAEMFKNFKDGKFVLPKNETKIGDLLNGSEKDFQGLRKLTPETNLDEKFLPILKKPTPEQLSKLKDMLKEIAEKEKTGEGKLNPFEHEIKEDIQLYYPDKDPGPKNLPFRPGDDDHKFL